MGRLSTLLIRAGYSPLLAEEMDAYLARFAPQEALQVLAWSFDALSRMSYEDYVREARIGWWDSAGVPFEFKRLLDSHDEGDAGKSLAAARIIQADERHAALAADEGGLLRQVAVASARRAWADAYRDWERAPFNPDAPPEAPVHAGLKGLWAFYERFKPGDFDPSHPAHALRLHLEAAKAWVEEDHPRHPAGTPADSETGAGGGRFAPAGEEDADGSQAAVPRFKTVAEAQTWARSNGARYADYKGMSLEAAQNLNDALAAVPAEMRPEFVGNYAYWQKVSGQKLAARQRENTYGVSLSYSSQIDLSFESRKLFGIETQDALARRADMVGLNTRMYKTPAAIEKRKSQSQMAYRAKTGRDYFFNTRGDATAHHEMGHIIFDQVRLPEWQSAARRWADSEPVDLLKDEREAFAEAWAAYHTGSAERLPDYVQAVIESVKHAD